MKPPGIALVLEGKSKKGAPPPPDSEADDMDLSMDEEDEEEGEGGAAKLTAFKRFTNQARSPEERMSALESFIKLCSGGGY